MEVKFFAEKTLGKLAKWLRILGFDTIYEQDTNIENDKALKIKDFILLSRTRNTRLKILFRTHIFITSDHLDEQLKQVISELNLKLSEIHPFSRCIRCNVSIKSVDKGLIKGKVPDYVWETQVAFQKCAKCNRIYWPGSHTDHTMGFIYSLF